MGIFNTKQHQAPKFARNSRLSSQYEQIGVELLKCESGESGYIENGRPELRAGLVTIPVEVLESYLEDLLDLSVSGESLYVARDRNRWIRTYCPGIGVSLGVILAAFIALTYGINMLSILGMAGGILIGACVTYLHPATSALRRMRFAKIISSEISRRRGRGDDDSGTATASGSVVLRGLFGTSPEGAGGAARVSLN